MLVGWHSGDERQDFARDLPRHATSGIWKVTWRPWPTTFVPILIGCPPPDRPIIRLRGARKTKELDHQSTVETEPQRSTRRVRHESPTQFDTSTPHVDIIPDCLGTAQINPSSGTRDQMPGEIQPAAKVERSFGLAHEGPLDLLSQGA
jgi:hypothetical protein